jgi:hypothetical protein
MTLQSQLVAERLDGSFVINVAIWLRANKPMVPTVPAQPSINPLGSLRRHLGRPLDNFGRRRRAAGLGHE